jgi:putative protease
VRGLPAKSQNVAGNARPTIFTRKLMTADQPNTARRGRPCDRHRVELKDREGPAHPLVADVGCRNTVFNASAQSAAEFVPRMKELGLRHFRVELLRETGDEAIPLLERYARVLQGVEDGSSTWRQLRVLNQLGITRGTLER